jgi:hypothetical protein
MTVSFPLSVLLGSGGSTITSSLQDVSREASSSSVSNNRRILELNATVACICHGGRSLLFSKETRPFTVGEVDSYYPFFLLHLVYTL